MKSCSLLYYSNEAQSGFDSISTAAQNALKPWVSTQKSKMSVVLQGLNKIESSIQTKLYRRNESVIDSSNSKFNEQLIVTEKQKTDFKKMNHSRSVTITRNGISILHKHLVRLKRDVWLNDEIINFCFDVFKERDKNENKHEDLQSLFFSTFFMYMLRGNDENGYFRIHYRNVERWTNFLTKRGKSIFDYDKLFFPVNINNTHWALIVVFIKQKTVTYFDSMCGPKGGVYFNRSILEWLTLEWLKVNKTATHEQIDEFVRQWQTIDAMPSLPQQSNGSDCGVFVLMNVDLISQNLSPTIVTNAKAGDYRIKLYHKIFSFIRTVRRVNVINEESEFYDRAIIKEMSTNFDEGNTAITKNVRSSIAQISGILVDLSHDDDDPVHQIDSLEERHAKLNPVIVSDDEESDGEDNIPEVETAAETVVAAEVSIQLAAEVTTQLADTVSVQDATLSHDSFDNSTEKETQQQSPINETDPTLSTTSEEPTAVNVLPTSSMELELQTQRQLENDEEKVGEEMDVENDEGKVTKPQQKDREEVAAGEKASTVEATGVAASKKRGATNLSAEADKEEDVEGALEAQQAAKKAKVVKRGRR